MNLDFHYYGTYYAASLAGFSPGDAEAIAYYAQFVDDCSESVIKTINKTGVFTEFQPAPTVQSDSELTLITANPKAISEELKNNITQIWSSFHFLPGNTELAIHYNGSQSCTDNEFKRLCTPNSKLVQAMAEKLKDDYSKAGSVSDTAGQRKMCEAIGMTMHILADTWAHCWFAGTPSKTINDVPDTMKEYIKTSDGSITKAIRFYYDPVLPDNLTKNHYSCTPRHMRLNSVFYLGHGRVGHLPDYSFMTYDFIPNWDSKSKSLWIKSNPDFFMNAFQQMVYVLKCLKDNTAYVPNRYEPLTPAVQSTISAVFQTRSVDTSPEWKQAIKTDFGVDLNDYSADNCVQTYHGATDRIDTPLYRFLKAASEHITLVNNYFL